MKDSTNDTKIYSPSKAVFNGIEMNKDCSNTTIQIILLIVNLVVCCWYSLLFNCMVFVHAVGDVDSLPFWHSFAAQPESLNKKAGICICRSANLQRLRSLTWVGDFILTLLQVQEASTEEEDINNRVGDAVDHDALLLAIPYSIRPCGRQSHFTYLYAY